MATISTKQEDTALLEAIKNLTSMIDELIMSTEALNSTMNEVLEAELNSDD